MADVQISRIVRRAGLDVVVWCCVPAVFLYCYVNFYAASTEAILPHLYLVLVGLLGLTVMRFGLCRLIPNRGTAYLITACVVAAALMTMLAYYAMVLIGLQTWARVVSAALITSYAMQLPQLVETLGMQMPYVGLLLVFVFASLVYAVRCYLRRFDWIFPLLPHVGGMVQLLVVSGGAAICIIAAYHFMLAPSAQRSEPLSLTFFPETMASVFQGHAIDNLHAERLDRIEDAARDSYQPAKEPAKSNLILIVVDALRPDHMGVYGYKRETTPNLSRLVQSGFSTVVSNVRASCGDSSCGLLSLASSKFLHQFSSRPFTLQQVLRRHGYKVNMILGGDHTNFYGLRKMYGEVDNYFDGSMAARGSYVNDDQLVLDYTNRLPDWSGQPVMLQFHLMSSHVLGKRHDRFAKFSPSANYAIPGHRTGSSRDEFVNFYDNGVLQADAVIQELLETLQAKGYLGSALVVITSDHGEALGEHGMFAHANSVREEALRIPLIFIPYGRQSPLDIAIPRAASQVDIGPTILTEFGFEIPKTWSGTALQTPQLNGYSYFQEGLSAGLIDHRDPGSVWKYWTDARSGREYAFNLTADSAEKSNVIDQVPGSLRREWRLQHMNVMHGILHSQAHSVSSGLPSH